MARRRWLVLPDSAGKIAWDWLVILLVLCNLIETPLILGFRVERPPPLIALNILIDILLLIDLLVSFRTCHYTTERHILLNVWENQLAYLKSWFLPDLISTIPYDLIGHAFAAGGISLGNSFDLMAKGIRLTRILRLLKLANHIDNLASFVSYYLLFVMLWTHWLACAMWAVGVAGDAFERSDTSSSGNGLAVDDDVYILGSNGSSWVTRLNLQHEDLPMRYLASFYYATLFAKSPWQQPGPGEFIWSNCIIVVCSVLYAAFVGSLTAVITSYDAHQGRQREALNYVRAFSRYRGLSITTQRRLVKNGLARTNGIDTQNDDDGA